MQMQISSVPLLTARTAATPKPAGTLVSARFTRRRSNEPQQAGHQGQGPVGMQKAAPLFKRAAF